jgi:hypothetical protein
LDCDATQVTHHFNVFGDLFGEGNFFHNVQDVQINYGGQSNVKFGNVIDTSLAHQQPSVSIENASDGFTTMLMVNLDGNIFETEVKNQALTCPEIIHWFVSNVKDKSGLESGETIVPYLQPTPFHGSGFHRIVFLFFRHDKPINVEEFQLKG